MNIPAFVSVLSGQKETAESMIDWCNPIRYCGIVKPATAPQSGSGIDNTALPDKW